MSDALSLAIDDGVAVVTFDMPGESVNKFSATVIAEFDTLLTDLERNPAIGAVVLLSGKPDVFIAGADIDAFLTFTGPGDAEAASAAGHALLRRLEQSRAPVVAAIHGACLGGGLEAVLACAHRIATDHEKTVFSFPEVQLGLIPGAGGTQRLPRTVGLRTALDMILTSRTVRAKKALQTGLVDELVHPAILHEIAMRRAREFAAGTRTRAARDRRPRGVVAAMLEGNPVGRALVFRQARHAILARTRGKFPAPLAAIDAIAAGYRGSPEDGFREEARLFGAMSVTPASRELIFLFYATTSLKRDAGVPGIAPPPLAIERLGVLGAGFMGAGIAAVAATHGVPVRLKDTKLDQVARGLGAVRKVLAERLAKRQITRQQFEDQLSLVSGTVEYTGFRRVQLVVEAVFEDLAVKHAVLAEAEAALSPGAIFATNTSTIPITAIATASKRPERVLGMHFFSPVHKMPLLEVIATAHTAPEVITTAVAFGRSLGKTVIVVNDSPGFFANRILAPYLNEAGRLLDEGIPIEAIDGALTDFGFPVGPIALLDEVGVDIAGKSGAILAGAFGDRLRPSASIGTLIEAGRLGRKAKKGFYLYDADGRKGGVDTSVYALFPSGAPRATLPAGEIQRRCVLAMVNEAARCLEERIVRQPRDGDIGAVFGIGFPPFRGGPYRYVDSTGAAEIVRQLEVLDAAHAGRFAPSALLAGMARNGSRFYPASGKPVG